MPATIDPLIKQRVIAQYLQGVSRDTIAANNGIGTGTVSNIIDDWKKGVQDSDYESIRELSVYCKKQGVTLNALVSCIRLNNYIQSLGANTNESTLESLISNLANYPDRNPAKLIEAAAQISESGITMTGCLSSKFFSFSINGCSKYIITCMILIEIKHHSIQRYSSCYY